MEKILKIDKRVWKSVELKAYIRKLRRMKRKIEINYFRRKIFLCTVAV